MALPTVVGTASWSGNSLTHMATMPTGIAAGDLIVVNYTARVVSGWGCWTASGPS